MRWFTRNSPSFIFRKCQLSPDNARSVLKDGCTFHFTGVSHSGHSSSLFRILVPKFSSLFSDKQWNRMMPLVRASESFWGEKLCVLEQVSSRVLLFTFWFNKAIRKIGQVSCFIPQLEYLSFPKLNYLTETNCIREWGLERGNQILVFLVSSRLQRRHGFSEAPVRSYLIKACSF